MLQRLRNSTDREQGAPTEIRWSESAREQCTSRSPRCVTETGRKDALSSGANLRGEGFHRLKCLLAAAKPNLS